MEGIKMDPEKITAVQDWEAPCNLKDIHIFLGFANFYYCFVQNYSKLLNHSPSLHQRESHLSGIENNRKHLII
jgi:hypothetical protein